MASATATATPFNGKKHTLYPNPITDSGPLKLFLSLTSASDVKAQIFTIAFRKIQEQLFPQVPVGTDVTLNLTDKWGAPLANGLYYVVVTTNEGRSIVKLLISK
jgi:hypothetical protein